MKRFCSTAAASAFNAIPPSILQKLSALGFNGATKVQSIAIPKILSGNSVVVTAQTGSGKTLTYLLPVMEHVTNMKPAVDETSEQNHRSRALILTPTRELCNQISKVGATLSNPPLVSSASVSISSPIVVTTPEYISMWKIDVSDFNTLVVDEADMMLDGSYKEFTETIINKIRKTHKNFHQFIFVAATMPSSAKGSPGVWIKRKFPTIEWVEIDGAHQILPQVKQNWIETTDADSANLEMKKAVQSHLSSGNALVFVNTVQSAIATAAFLNNQGIETLEFHSAKSENEREQVLEKLEEKANGVVVVCTDMGCRGLDTCSVYHIVQRDFALNALAHLHRLGRTARRGQDGIVTNIIVSNNSNNLLAEKMKTLKPGEKIDASFSRRRGLRKKFRRKTEK